MASLVRDRRATVFDVQYSNNKLQVVSRTPTLAEVMISDAGRPPLTVGTVRLSGTSWYWRHNDGERSSPVAPTRLEAAQALAMYHREFKPRRSSASIRELLARSRYR